MKLKDFFKPEVFKNKKIANLVAATLELEEEFVAKGAPYMIPNILLNVADALKEEKQAIEAIMIAYQGKAFKSTFPKARTRVSFAPRKKVTRKPSVSTPCKNCGKSNAVGAVKTVKTVDKLASKRKPAITVKEEPKFKSWMEVSNYFHNNVDDMKKFAEEQRISLGNRKRPEVLAKFIFAQLQKR